MTNLLQLAKQIIAPKNFFKEISADQKEISFTNPKEGLFINLELRNADHLKLTDDASCFELIYPKTYQDLTQSQKILMLHYLKPNQLQVDPNNSAIYKYTNPIEVQAELIKFAHQLHLIKDTLQKY